MAVSNTGSRNGIITWAVVATILGVGSLIWAVISFTQANKAQKDLENISKRYVDVIDQGGLSGDDVTALKAIRDDASRGFTPQTKLLEVARRQAQALTTLIGGPAAATDKEARAAVEAAINSARAASKGTDGTGKEAAIDGSSLVATIKSLSEYATSLQRNNAQLTEQLAAAQKSAIDAQEQKAKVDAASNEKVEVASKQAAEAQANADLYAQSQDQQLTTVTEDAANKVQQGIRNAEELNDQLNLQRQQFAQVKRENDDLKAQLASFRVPVDQIVQQADGVITKTSGTDRVFINLGRGDQIAAGMTFEVYDRLGVPRVATEDAADDQLLKGKASIEVVNTQQGISECRVVRLSPGAAITEGDPIVNVVYDKNVKFNFHVFGKFNLDYQGVATDRDTDIVRRLISGWGGNVQDQLDTKTDFVVLGEEPVVPSYTQDELAREPEKAFEKEQSEAALDAYNELRVRANQLNIPILNQTRFLYMVGYYEEAAR
jgi:hypothetical protein